MTVNSNEGAPSPTAPERSRPEQAKEPATGTAHDVRDEVTTAVSDVKGETAAQIGNVKDEAMSKADDLLGQARGQVASHADEGTHQLADTLVAAGRELTAMAERSEQADGPMTTVVRRVGTRATEMGERFGSGGYKALAGDLTGFARSSPGLFLLAAAGTGFAVGRVVRNADTKAIASAARDTGSPDADPAAIQAGLGAVPGASTRPPLDDRVAAGADPYPTAAATAGEDALRRSAAATLGEV